MADIIRTQKRDYKYNGPVSSSDYNARVQENYDDLVYLYNKASGLDFKLKKAFERVLKDHISLSNALKDIEDRLEALEATENRLSIYSFSQMDYTSFVGTSFAISGTELLSFDPHYNIITLPKVSNGSYSKLKFNNSIGGQLVPEFFKSLIDNIYNGVDSSGAVIESSPVYNAVLDDPEKVWSRTIVANSANVSGAQMMLYVRVPSEVAGSVKTNMIKLNPYPAFGSDIYSIEYTSKQNPSLSESDGWQALNSSALYEDESDAIGKVAPGGWSTLGSDTIYNSGPVAFVFPDKDITAIRIKFHQRNYFVEQNKYIYTYGLSDLDVRYDKYLPTGRTMFKFTPSNGDLINEITNVSPKIFNVPRSLMSQAFSYRVIYESGGLFSLQNPGSSSSVWIEVTLNKLQDGTPPVLSDLIIDYI